MMRSRLWAGVVVAMGMWALPGAGATPASAAVIAHWHFNDSDLAADVGTGTVTATFPPGAGGATPFVTGTTANAQPGVVAGNALAVTDTTAVEDTYYGLPFELVFSFSTVGYSQIRFNLAAMATAAADWNTAQLLYAVSANGGVTFQSVGQLRAGDGVFSATGTFNLGSTYSNKPNFRMRISQNISSTTPGFVAFDNVTFTGTPIPEPASALALTATGATALLVHRRG